jgi:hypothetical protein
MRVSLPILLKIEVMALFRSSRLLQSKSVSLSFRCPKRKKSLGARSGLLFLTLTRHVKWVSNAQNVIVDGFLDVTLRGEISIHFLALSSVPGSVLLRSGSGRVLGVRVIHANSATWSDLLCPSQCLLDLSRCERHQSVGTTNQSLSEVCHLLSDSV